MPILSIPFGCKFGVQSEDIWCFASSLLLPEPSCQGLPYNACGRNHWDTPTGWLVSQGYLLHLHTLFGRIKSTNRSASVLSPPAVPTRARTRAVPAHAAERSRSFPGRRDGASAREKLRTGPMGPSWDPRPATSRIVLATSETVFQEMKDDSPVSDHFPANNAVVLGFMLLCWRLFYFTNDLCRKT